MDEAIEVRLAELPGPNSAVLACSALGIARGERLKQGFIRREEWLAALRRERILSGLDEMTAGLRLRVW